MTRIGLLSDTHAYWDEKYLEYFESCDEIWHAGDIGSVEVAEKLAAFRPLRAVYGNIDGLFACKSAVSASTIRRVSSADSPSKQGLRSGCTGGMGWDCCHCWKS